MRRVGTIVAVLVAVGVSVGARAQQPDQEARYRQLVGEAVTEFDAGRWEEALALFRAAHEVIPSARTLRGIGMAAFEMRQYVDARRSLEQALTDARRPLTTEQRAEVQRLVERARTFTGRFRIRATPPDAQITINGASPALEQDGSVLLAISQAGAAYEIAAAMRGYRSARRPLVVRGGEDEEIFMPLELETAAGPDGGDGVEGLLDRRRRRQGDTGGGTSGFGIALSVTGGAMVIGGLVTGILLVRNVSELEECEAARDPSAGGMFCMNRDTLRNNRDITMGLTIGLGVAGVAGLATGIVLMATSGSSSEPATERRGVRCTPGLGGIVCAGRF